MTDQQAIDEIKGLLGANTLIDALRTLREWRELISLKPIVSTDSSGMLHIAPLTVRQTMQLLAALEGLQVTAK